MIIKISETIHDSKFYFGAKKKPAAKEYMDFETAIGHIVVNEKCDYETAKNQLKGEYESWKAQLESRTMKPLLPNINTKKLFQFFKWHCNMDGTVSEYVKSSVDREEYVLTNDVLNTAKVLYPMPESKDSLFDMMNDLYYELKGSNKLFLRGKQEVEGKADDNNPQNVDVMSAETLTKYWDSVFKAYWQEDNTFKLKEQPKVISSDPKEPCFFFFDKKIVKDGPTPNWDGWLTTMPEYMRPVFMSWIYSIFDPKNKGRQCLWLEDHGYTGKSSMTMAISKFMNQVGVGALSKDSLSNQFGYSNVYGKRFIIYGDNKNPRLLSSEKVHSVLGGDTVSIERKGKQAFTGTVHARILVASNCKPEIDMYARNEDTRIIHIKLSDPDIEVMKKYCAVKDGKIQYYPNGTPVFIGGNLEEELFSEMPAFLFKAQQHYEKICPNRKDIILPELAIRDKEDNCASIEMEKFERFVQDSIEFGESYTCLPYDLQEEYREFNNNKNVTTLEFGQLKKFLSVIHKIDQKRIKIGENRIRALIGMRIKGTESEEIGGIS